MKQLRTIIFDNNQLTPFILVFQEGLRTSLTGKKDSECDAHVNTSQRQLATFGMHSLYFFPQSL